MKGRAHSSRGRVEEPHRSSPSWAEVTGAWLVVAVLFVTLLMAL